MTFRKRLWDYQEAAIASMCGVLLFVFLSGCLTTPAVEKGAVEAKVDAPVKADVTGVKTGDTAEATGTVALGAGGGWGIGTINVAGDLGFAMLLVIAALIGFFLWLRGHRATKLVDVLVDKNEDILNGTAFVQDKFKKDIRKEALKTGTQSMLRKRVDKVRMKRLKND